MPGAKAGERFDLDDNRRSVEIWEDPGRREASYFNFLSIVCALMLLDWNRMETPDVEPDVKPSKPEAEKLFFDTEWKRIRHGSISGLRQWVPRRLIR